MASNAVYGGGAGLYLYDSTGVTPTKIAEVVDMPIAISKAILEASSHDSGMFVERKPGKLDMGPMNFDLMWLAADAVHAELLSLLMDTDPQQATRKFHIQCAGTPAAKVTWDAYVTGLNLPQKHDDLQRGQLQVTQTGPFTVTIA